MTTTMALRAPALRVRPATTAGAPLGPARRRLRLTRRGRAVRAVVLVLALTLVFLVVSALGHSVVSASTSESGEGPALRALVVQPGQTLWQIAGQVAPDADPRDTVVRLERLNGLDGALIQVGQRLLVPVNG
ncbi:MAG TPA: LysM peptidoglycan-binding domain-containing protein [Actinomycetes bacterium]|nr:LysM peptidoglycan-binding domain-containing protein [Actinomycetes bacterium]